MTDPNYWPSATVKVTVKETGETFTLVHDTEYAYFQNVGADLVELCEQVKSGQVGKSIDDLKSWFHYAFINSYRKKFNDGFDRVDKKDLPRVEGTADYQFSFEITKLGNIIITYNEYGNKPIRYKAETFSNLVSKSISSGIAE